MQRLAFLQGWYLRNDDERFSKRGNRFLRIGEAAYNQLARANNAPTLEDCAGQANGEWLKAAIEAANKSAEEYREELLVRYQKQLDKEQRAFDTERRTEQQGLRSTPASFPRPVPTTLLAAQDELANIMNKFNNAPPSTSTNNDDGLYNMFEAEPPTPEELYLIITGILETQNGDSCPACVVRALLKGLRRPENRRRVAENLQLIDYHPRNATEEDMKLDLWRFDRPPVNPAAQRGAGGPGGGGGGGGGGGNRGGGGGDGGGGPGDGGPRPGDGSNMGGSGGNYDTNINIDDYDINVDDSFDFVNWPLGVTVSVGAGKYLTRGFSEEEFQQLPYYPQKNNWLFNLKELVTTGKIGGKAPLTVEIGNEETSSGENLSGITDGGGSNAPVTSVTNTSSKPNQKPPSNTVENNVPAKNMEQPPSNPSKTQPATSSLTNQRKESNTGAPRRDKSIDFANIQSERKKQQLNKQPDRKY
ncbi:hypothetical protein R1flu_026682 [Riccia fluitans]|uniref:Uncharacterized protein n=1 Tax=Riccia fluitans TaxID=41844 RepID=A0ABD1XGL7_9MARC